MRNNINILVFSLAALLALVAIFAFGTKETEQKQMADAMRKAEFGNLLAGMKSTPVNFRKDTITNANNDTLIVAPTVASAHQYAFQVQTIRLSGTQNIKFVLEQQVAISGGRWMRVDSTTATGVTGTNYWLMKNANTWGQKYRIIADGTGTQSTAYQVDGLLKPTAQ